MDSYKVNVDYFACAERCLGGDASMLVRGRKAYRPWGGCICGVCTGS
jgi:hypothetical protein